MGGGEGGESREYGVDMVVAPCVERDFQALSGDMGLRRRTNEVKWYAKQTLGYPRAGIPAIWGRAAAGPRLGFLGGIIGAL